MCFGNQFPWISFLRERGWESSDWYRDICWRLGNRTLPCGKHTSQECCRESAQSISPTVSRGHNRPLLWCLFCKRLSAVFQASWVVAKLRFGYEFLSLLSLNLKQVFFLLWKVSDIHRSRETITTNLHGIHLLCLPSHFLFDPEYFKENPRQPVISPIKILICISIRYGLHRKAH